MKTILDWANANPWVWPMVIWPLVGVALSLAAPPLVTRFPALAPVLDWMLHKAWANAGSIDKTRAAARRGQVAETERKIDAALGPDASTTPVIKVVGDSVEPPPKPMFPPSDPPKGAA